MKWKSLQVVVYVYAILVYADAVAIRYKEIKKSPEQMHNGIRWLQINEIPDNYDGPLADWIKIDKERIKRL